MKYSISRMIIRGESGQAEKIALVCDMVMLAVFIWNQIRYGMNMLFLIIPLFAIGFFLLFSILPEEYYFTQESLEIRHKYRKTISIPYESVFNYEASRQDAFINVGQSNKVKLYYMADGKKRALLCRPKDVESFEEAIKKNCPEFQGNSKMKSSIEVFFNQNK